MQPKLYAASEHDIDSELIDPDALWVVRKLRKAGFEAFIVGGSIRDLLAGKKPKDFDVSTSALPEQIKDIFGRRCLLIGRRFRLAHVRFGPKVIEVATFRSGENEEDLIVRDNQWGTAEEDVLRRDFTINGLFYDPEEHMVIDYVGGWEDIHKKTLRAIGDPVVRFKQDPVRMIRLLKFKARFGFNISEEAHLALTTCRSEITKSSPARILEEVFRMLESGASEPFIKLMKESELLHLIFPSLTHVLEMPHGDRIYGLLHISDEINLQENRAKPLERAILTSCLLFPIIENEIRTQYPNKEIAPNMGEVMQLTNTIIKAFITSSFSHFPRRLSATMSFILTSQYRLTPLVGKRHPRPKLMKHREFALSLEFLKIRALLDKELMGDYAFWRDTYRQVEQHTPAEPSGEKWPRRRRRRRRRGDAEVEQAPNE